MEGAVWLSLLFVSFGDEGEIEVGVEEKMRVG